MVNVSANILVENITDLPAFVQALLAQRETARKLNDFAESDRLRDEIKLLGYLVNDDLSDTKVLKIGDEETIPAKSFPSSFFARF
jgi:cysteinyl-tRNA synthetase